MYVSTPLNKWNEEDHWNSMEQDGLLFQDLPEFTPPNRSTKKSQKKSVAIGSPDINGLQQVGFSMSSTHECASKRDTNGMCMCAVSV